MARVNIHKEVKIGEPNDWNLCFQWCEYVHDEEDTEYGYRFIWRKPDGSLQATRGQARIPGLKEMNELTALAAYDGWLGIVESQINE